MGSFCDICKSLDFNEFFKFKNAIFFQLTRTTCSFSSSIIILFGSSVQTAKEAYKILIPSTNPSVLPTFINESSTVRQILLQLIQSDDLNSIFSTPLPVTNTFVLFERKCLENRHDNLLELKNFKLNKSCRKFLINFVSSTDFEVFDDDDQMVKENVDVAGNVDEDEVWYQSRIFVKGFNDATVDTKTIWK